MASSEASLDKKRSTFIQQRQAELDSVLDRHDDLVREAFHLDQFVTLLSYDPKVAKEDNSKVFQEYQANFDLMTESSEAGPSRRTRRAQTERLQSLKGSQPSPSALPPKKMRSNKIQDETDATTPFWSILAESKGKGKGKQNVIGDGDMPPPLPKYDPKGKGKGRAIDADTPSRAVPRARSLKHMRESTLDAFIPVNGESGLPPSKKRKLKSRSHADLAGSARFFDSEETPESMRATQDLEESSMSVGSASGAGGLVTPSSPSSPSKNPSRRVKLIVRRPLPSFTNPRQKPPPPQFERSLEKLLTSYTILNGAEAGLETIERTTREEVAFWDKVDTLHAQGRFLFPADASGLVDLSSYSSRASTPLVGAGERKKDVWAHVVDAVKQRTLEQPAGDGRAVAGQVAGKVKAYWEAKAAREDKFKGQEEKRLRMLAKATIKMVVAEWKKAVYHIREQERLRLEEEERKRGHAHLDAILSQSGQILEAQHMDLSRPSGLLRSHSSSVNSRSSSPDSDDDEGIDSGTEDEEMEGDYDTDLGSDHENETEREEFSSMLLLGDSHDDGDSPGGEVRGDGSSAERSVLEESRSYSGVSTPEADHDFEMDSEDARSSRELVYPDPARTPSPIPTRGSGPEVTGGEFLLEELPSHNLDLDKDNSHDLVSFWQSQGDVPVSSPLGLLPLDSEDASPLGLPADLTQVAHTNGDTPLTNGFSRYGESQAPSLEKEKAEIEARLPQTESASVVANEANEDPDEGGFSSAAGGIHDYDQEQDQDQEDAEDAQIPHYLRPYAVAPVDWEPQSKVKAPVLLRGNLRPYQQAGLEWLASIHTSNLNGILADEMGLGKTIQTIALLAHLACDRGIWGPHLIIVPTSVLLNWEMEFKKFLPGFKVLSYHGNTKRRKELRQGWNNKYHFNVCVTSYTLASRDAHVFKRKPWYYMILDEAHMIKNFKSQRWSTLLMFRSFRRLLLTGTPLQNNLTELWALLQFLMSGTNFANLKEFGDWFANPLEKAIEMGTIDEETQQRVSKLHTVLRPYLLRRLKRDVEKELPQKYEHLVLCSLSKRQRLLYDEFMARADTKQSLSSGVYYKIANILMQLRKVVNHPNLFEVRPIVTSFVVGRGRSAGAEWEAREELIRRRLSVWEDDEDRVNLGELGLKFVEKEGRMSFLTAMETRRLDATEHLPMITELPGEPPPRITRTIKGYKRLHAWQQRAERIARWTHIGYLNRLRCSHVPIYGSEVVAVVRKLYEPLVPLSAEYGRMARWDLPDVAKRMVLSYEERAENMRDVIEKFAFVTPAVVVTDLPRYALSGSEAAIHEYAASHSSFDAGLHLPAAKLQIAFPDRTLLQYDCGKLQALAELLRERKAGGHRVLIFTQMTRVLDILEQFMSLHGWLYLRLDGATRIEDRQYITERFNSDARVFCFISSSRSGGVGINLTGADTVVFYDSDFNPQMDRQCEDRAHRIGQIRDVHIYRFVSQYTVEEALLRKANQKRSLDDLVIQKGEFDWRSLFGTTPDGDIGAEAEAALTRALGEVEDQEDAHAAAVAAKEEVAMEGADEADFSWEGAGSGPATVVEKDIASGIDPGATGAEDEQEPDHEQEGEEDGEEEGGTTVDYMLAFVKRDYEHFSDWRL